MPHDEGGCEASASALSRDCDARQMSSQRWRRAKSGTDREEATGTGPSVKSTIDYLDRCLINYLDHSQLRRHRLGEAVTEERRDVLGESPGIIKASGHATAGHLIVNLNPIIRGWANYHRHVVEQADLLTSGPRNLSCVVAVGQAETTQEV